MSASGSGPSAAIPAIPAAGPQLVKREDLGDDDERVCKAPVPGSNNQAPEAGEWHKLGKLPQDGGSPALEYGKLCADLSKDPRLLACSETGCCYVLGVSVPGGQPAIFPIYLGQGPFPDRPQQYIGPGLPGGLLGDRAPIDWTKAIRPLIWFLEWLQTDPAPAGKGIELWVRIKLFPYKAAGGTQGAPEGAPHKAAEENALAGVDYALNASGPAGSGQEPRYGDVGPAPWDQPRGTSSSRRSTGEPS